MNSKKHLAEEPETPSRTNIIPINLQTIARKDKIGVVITTYNNSTTIAKASQTAANQILLPDEIIVSDDCSSGNTI